jgi:Winged helix-turn-helix DNA-binding
MTDGRTVKNFCESCGVEVSRSGPHKFGVLHKQSKRIRALLKNPCITYEEIADRVGVSRQRIHQIYERRLGGEGTFRRNLCPTSHHIPKPPRDNSLAARVKDVCESNGLTVQFILGDKHNPDYHETEIAVNGHRCYLRVAGHTRRGFTNIKSPSAPDRETEFCLYLMRDGQWIVLPRSRWPKSQTVFQALPNLDGVGFTKHCRHDYPEFIENWKLLRNA